MKKRWIVGALLMVALVLPGAARAHEGHIHKALGTIAGVQGEHVEIKTTDGKTVTVVVDKKTTVTRGKDTLDATALKVGERVSVDYMEQNKTMIAQGFKLATTAATKK
jgi:hypothetical protein